MDIQETINRFDELLSNLVDSIDDTNKRLEIIAEAINNLEINR